MAKGNNIIVTGNPKGTYDEGWIVGAIKPGTIMEMTTTAPVGGRFYWQPYQPGSDGEQRVIAILLPDKLQGKLATDAYVDGDRCFLYYPLPGEQLNVLVDDIAGTADDVAIGDVFMVDSGLGRLLATAGSPESEPFVALEAVTDPTADHLVWCRYTGY